MSVFAKRLLSICAAVTLLSGFATISHAEAGSGKKLKSDLELLCERWVRGEIEIFQPYDCYRLGYYRDNGKRKKTPKEPDIKKKIRDDRYDDEDRFVCPKFHYCPQILREPYYEPCLEPRGCDPLRDPRVCEQLGICKDKSPYIIIPEKHGSL